MTKQFCDICGAPVEAETKMSIFLPIGERYVGPSGSLLQNKIVARGVIVFCEHPTEFGGSPDLCRRCIGAIVEKMLHTYQEIGQKE